MATDAIGNYSNLYIRPGADLLAQEYNRGKALQTQWNALGGGQAATNVMSAALLVYAQQLVANHATLWGLESTYEGWGTTLSIAGTTTLNDGAGVGGDNRPQINGNQAVAIVTNWRSRLNWLAAGTATWPTTTPISGGGANLNTVIACIETQSAANFGNLLNRIGELITQYEASSKAVINAIEQVAVNVN